MTGTQVYGMLKASKVGECFLSAHRALDATLELAGLGQDGKPMVECRGLFSQRGIMQRAFGIDVEINESFGHWLAGFVDGEGSFLARIQTKKTGYEVLSLRFQIILRADDLPILERIRKEFGVGNIYRRIAYPDTISRHPQYHYSVHGVGDLYWVIVPFFEKFPLRAKKAKDFATWKELVRLYYYHSKNRGNQALPKQFWREVTPLIQLLKDGRVFKEPLGKED